MDGKIRRPEDGEGIFREVKGVCLNSNNTKMTLSDFITQNKQKEITVGMWYTQCCEEDLKQFKSQEEIEDIVNAYYEDGIDVPIWNSQSEALKALVGSDSL